LAAQASRRDTESETSQLAVMDDVLANWGEQLP
jgi:hypothetical protein